jgi:Domain of unknown function (DUF4168)
MKIFHEQFCRSLELICSNNLQAKYRLTLLFLLVILVMKLPHLLQVSLLVCVVSVVAGTQRSMAATNVEKIDSVLSFSPAATIQIAELFPQQPGQIALYQAVSDGELRRYALAIIEMEPLRLEALQAIKSKVGSVPSLMCHQPGNLDGLPADAQRIFVKHCDQASNIASKNGLSMDSFNRITAAVSGDAGLRSRLQNIVKRLQGG